VVREKGCKSGTSIEVKVRRIEARCCNIRWYGGEESVAKVKVGGIGEEAERVGSGAVVGRWQVRRVGS